MVISSWSCLAHNLDSRVSPPPPPMAFMGAWCECFDESFEMRISWGLKASMSWG